MRMISTVVLCVALVAGSAHANAQAGLANEDDINQALLIVAVADKIRRGCDSISARYFKARAFANKLKEKAVERGYSDAEIEAYVTNSENKAAMRLRRNAYYKKHGASNLDHESLCVLGHKEIRKKSQIGMLLKAK